MGTRPTSLARTKALANCANNWHRWHPTFSLGEKVCTVCGVLAYCPFCTSRFPGTNAQLIACPMHREREEAKA
jgi:hypothetical protein